MWHILYSTEWRQRHTRLQTALFLVCYSVLLLQCFTCSQWEGVGIRGVEGLSSIQIPWSVPSNPFLQILKWIVVTKEVIICVKFFVFLVFFVFVDYASCNGFIERCSQPLSQRSLNIHFRLNQVQWQQKK